MSKTNNLPKHIAQMVEKNNLVLAIKELAAEQKISMSEAKLQIDAYEAKLKQQHAKKRQAIANKQQKHQPRTTKNSAEQLSMSVDKQLDAMGYIKPAVPYWVKRLLTILVICAVLMGLFYWKFVY